MPIEFQLGDVVRRISDGQKMFVHAIGSWSTGAVWVECIWYDAQNEHRAKYGSSAIEHWTEPNLPVSERKH
jgi:uncharacterized protein YodC (DUF2158 family)